MARPKKKDDTQQELSEFSLQELMKDTDFKIASTGSLMHSRAKIKTPLEVLNCMFGGGLPLGMISEVSGKPGGGKSTFLYQCMATYQKEFPSGVPIILDTESSMDRSRLEALGIDMDAVLRLPATSMEDCFSNMFKVLNKLEKVVKVKPDISAFIIYDSLAGGGTSKQYEATHKENAESAFGQGPLMEAQRIVKQNLANVIPYLENFPVFLGLINQVFTQVDRYGNASVKAGGAWALKHFDHCHIVFGDNKDEYDGDFIVGTSSAVHLEKSKLSPKMQNIPCYIDITKGGLIDEEKSFALYIAKSVGFLNTDAWYSFSDSLKMLLANKYPQLKDHAEFLEVIEKKFRKDDLPVMLKENKDLYLILRIALIDFLDNIYSAQRDVNSEYQQQLISQCAYLV